MTDEQATAERLAREIVAELALYNRERIDGAADLRRALMNDLLEGREVFRSRVVPARYPVFDACVAAWLAEHGQPIEPGNEVLPALVPALHETPREEPRTTPFVESYLLPRARQAAVERNLRKSRPVTIAVCAVLALGVVLIVTWNLRGH